MPRERKRLKILDWEELEAAPNTHGALSFEIRGSDRQYPQERQPGTATSDPFDHCGCYDHSGRKAACRETYNSSSVMLLGPGWAFSRRGGTLPSAMGPR